MHFSGSLSATRRSLLTEETVQTVGNVAQALTRRNWEELRDWSLLVGAFKRSHQKVMTIYLRVILKWRDKKNLRATRKNFQRTTSHQHLCNDRTKSMKAFAFPEQNRYCIEKTIMQEQTLFVKWVQNFSSQAFFK